MNPGVICDRCFTVHHGVRAGFACNNCDHLEGSTLRSFGPDGKTFWTKSGITHDFFWIDQIGGSHRLYLHPEGNSTLLCEKGLHKESIGRAAQYCRTISKEYVELHPNFLKGYPFKTSEVPREFLRQFLSETRERWKKMYPGGRYMSNYELANIVFEINDMTENDWKSYDTQMLCVDLSIL